MIRTEAIHFHEQRIQRLFTFVMATRRTAATYLAQRIQFVDENDRWSPLQCLLKHVADPRGADADEHLHEVRTGQTEEWHTRFTGHGFGEHCLARTWRANEQHAARNASTESLIFLGRPQELNDFFQFFDCFVNPRHVIEGNMHVFLSIQPPAAPSKRHRRTGAADTPQDENEGSNKHGRDQQHGEHGHPIGRQFRAVEPNFHFIKLVLELRPTHITEADQRNMEAFEFTAFTRQSIFARRILPCERSLRQRYFKHLAGVQRLLRQPFHDLTVGHTFATATSPCDRNHDGCDEPDRDQIPHAVL